MGAAGGMAELEVSVVLGKRKCSNQEHFLYRLWIFKVILSAGRFCIIYGKEIPKKWTSLFKTLSIFSVVSRTLESFFFFTAMASNINRP